MIVLQTVVQLTVLASVLCEDLIFPPGFKFGAATAAYQVEGAWNVSDKGENIWDRFTHAHPEKITGGDNGDIACDSYHQWEKDIELASNLGLHFYRFSISWTRLLPTGFSNHVSKDGVRYYNNLIDGLLAKGIEPFVTLYHWDLPQNLQDLGGWTNPLIANWFYDYAKVVFTLFGDRVKLWVTINEALVVCDLAYNTGAMAPGIVDPDNGAYICNKNVLMAHAKAWRLYDEEFKPKYHGEVSLANPLFWFEPETEADEEIAELARENMVGRYSHPIYSEEGGWPPAIEKIMAENSKKKGYPKSTFPAFTEDEKKFVRGTFDFYAFNHYTSRVIRKAKKGEETFEPWPLGDAPDLGGMAGPHPSWKLTAAPWFYIYPEGIRRQLVWLKKHYGDIKYAITESGLATFDGLDDQDRVNYYKDYLRQILLAIEEDGVNVTHYTAWTLIDNFEWADGYSIKFGLYEVDFSDPLRTRRARASAKFYKELIRKNSIQKISGAKYNDEL